MLSSIGRINYSSFSNITNDEAEGAATCHRPRHARFGGFDTQEGTLGLVGGK
jgi:hypothetical protein